MSAHTPGPWKLIWYGTERYPFPLSIHSANDANWITRDGTVSSKANARLIAAAPRMLAWLADFNDEQPTDPTRLAKYQDDARAILRDVEGESNG